MPARDGLSVRGLGLRIPGVTEPGDLARQISGSPASPYTVRRFDAPHTDLEPVDRRIYGPAEPRMPASVAVRGLRSLPHESLLALAAATEAEAEAAAAVRPREAGPGPAAVLWASSSAGLAEYATICVEAAVLDPGLSSPIIGPASAFNGPAATVSIRLGLNGPNETLTGGTTAGMSALVEAERFIADGDAGRALVGASATVSRWSLPGVAGDLVPAEGAACLALEPWRDGDSAIRLGRCRRVGLDRSRLVTEVREFVRSAPGPGPIPGSAVVVSTAGISAAGIFAARISAAGISAAGISAGGISAAGISAGGAELVEALSEDHPGPVWHLERVLGDFGAAGGLMAVVCAVAYCAIASSPTTVLALAVEPSGNASIMEVSSWGAPTSSSGW